MQNLTYSPINERRCSRRRSFTRKTDICHKFKEYNFTARIDIHCEIQAVPFSQLSQLKPGEPSAVIRERVVRARKIQEERFRPFKGVHCNAQMTERMLHQFAEPDESSLDLLRMAMERLKLSARAYKY